ncbi:uncharacterized protein N7479_008028 [Penicillium vulpinum]|uniref:uncharacterized protein n=1 Tax=Penicillium vulpinum TaxID=29845 RepID=UPI0025477EC8|nr:uncharacterized protein N7479_008028 [Penicillium vulpinum]KAJ5960878.1 hypothetical protein N7479_008028 [Penicillium vulpinum]
MAPKPTPTSHFLFNKSGRFRSAQKTCFAMIWECRNFPVNQNERLGSGSDRPSDEAIKVCRQDGRGRRNRLTGMSCVG